MSSGTSNDHVRRHNLSAVLGLVHRHRGLSRASLTRETGLNRSTTAALVAELVELGLVVESGPTHLADSSRLVGRPSPTVLADPTIVAVAVNPEIDAITVAIIGLNGEIRGRLRRPVECPSVADAVSISAAAIRTLIENIENPENPENPGNAEKTSVRAVAIGVAVPGLVRTGDGLIRLAPHLGWIDESFATLLAEATGHRVFAANDADLGILAESTFGAGRGFTDLIYLNGGASGIGGGIIAGGRVLGGAAGYAGEFGHTLVNSAGITCHCAASGCLETEVRRENLLTLVGLADADADALEGALLSSTDLNVAAEVRRQLDFLAVALRNAINMLNPQRVILGGFLGSLTAALPGYLDARVAESALPASQEGVSIIRSELGPDLLMIGAAERAFEVLLQNPVALTSARME